MGSYHESELQAEGKVVVCHPERSEGSVSLGGYMRDQLLVLFREHSPQLILRCAQDDRLGQDDKLWQDDKRRRPRRPAWAIVTTVCLIVLTACGGPTGAPSKTGGNATQTEAASTDGEVVVFAASSLKDAFGALAANLKEKALPKVEYNFAGSQTLAAQLAQGARADVFASADMKTMDAAVASGAVVSGTQRGLATNRLVVITPPGEDSKVSTLKDLAYPGLKLVLADPSVPAGNYSLQALDKLSADPAYGKDFKDRTLGNVVSRESNVRQVVAKVQLGEADAGIVYVTDARASGQSSGKAVRTLDIPEAYNVLARYYIAPVKGAAHPRAAQVFIDYALSEAGQHTLETYGFGRGEQGK